MDLSEGLHEQIRHIQTPGYYADKMHADVLSVSYALKLKSLVPQISHYSTTDHQIKLC